MGSRAGSRVDAGGTGEDVTVREFTEMGSAFSARMNATRMPAEGA